MHTSLGRGVYLFRETSSKGTMKTRYEDKYLLIVKFSEC